MLKLCILPITEAEKIPAELCERLFPRRMARARRFRRREDALRCIGAGALTALVLDAKEKDISCNAWGKPYLRGHGPCFNLSHSGDYVLMAVDDRNVGADIEKNGCVNYSAAARVFTAEELKWMDEAPERRFYALWTMKESVMKLDGRGFQLASERISVLPILNGGTILTDSGAVYGITQQFRDCTLSVCALHPITETDLRVFTAEELTQLCRLQP